MQMQCSGKRQKGRPAYFDAPVGILGTFAVTESAYYLHHGSRVGTPVGGEILPTHPDRPEA